MLNSAPDPTCMEYMMLGALHNRVLLDLARTVNIPVERYLIL